MYCFHKFINISHCRNIIYHNNYLPSNVHTLNCDSFMLIVFTHAHVFCSDRLLHELRRVFVGSATQPLDEMQELLAQPALRNGVLQQALQGVHRRPRTCACPCLRARSGLSAQVRPLCLQHLHTHHDAPARSESQSTEKRRAIRSTIIIDDDWNLICYPLRYPFDCYRHINRSLYIFLLCKKFSAK